MHTTLRWTACALAAAGLLMAACGSDDDDVTTRPAAPSVADVSGSDRHLYNLGAESVSPAAIAEANRAATLRLQGQADQIAEAQAKRQAAVDAEEAERQAHLDGQARTYGP
jgi:hypothetical protein